MTLHRPLIAGEAVAYREDVSDVGVVAAEAGGLIVRWADGTIDDVTHGGELWGDGRVVRSRRDPAAILAAHLAAQRRGP